MIKIYLRLFIGLLITIFFTGCPAGKVNKEAEWKGEILKTDKEFSDLSKKEGMKKAFIEYMDDNGVLLRPDHMPIVGANAIEFLMETNDTSFTLTWIPSYAQVALSGDLGYTYGIYNLQLQDTLLQGTYVSIWKKKKDKWKFVLDSGNPGIKQ